MIEKCLRPFEQFTDMRKSNLTMVTTTTAIQWACRQGYIMESTLVDISDGIHPWQADEQVSAVDKTYKAYFDCKQRAQ